MRRPLVLSLSACLLLASACKSEDPPVSDESESESGEPEDPGPTPNPFAEAVYLGLGDYVGTIDPEQVIEDGDATHYRFSTADGPLCLRGAPYWMSVRAGSHDASDLLIYLGGGGVCSAGLCDAPEVLGDPAVPNVGMLNRGLADNPFADWNVVYMPYCDGSLFIGDFDSDDDDDNIADRFQRGLINLTVGLDIAVERFSEASRIVLVGSGAAAYGVYFSDMLVRTLWSEAEIIVVPDGGVGIGKPGDLEFLPGLLTEWNIARLIPDDCYECVNSDHITNIPDWQLELDANMRFATVASHDDAVIGGSFLGLGEGEYRAALEAELGELAGAHPGRYSRFLFDSELHTTTAADSGGGGMPGVSATFDDTRVAGTSVAEWLGMLLTGDPEFGDLVE